MPSRILAAVAFLLLLFLAPAACFAQQKVKTKGPMYEDEAIVIFKNQLQVRLPVGFYAYHFAASTYEEKHFPILLGARYEHLLNSRMALGGELEYNFWDPRPVAITGTSKADDYPFNQLPEKESTLKFTPHIRFYMRGHKRRKDLFKGVFVQVGPTLYSTTQVVDQYMTSLKKKMVPDSIRRFQPVVYKSSSGFGFSAAIGFSHMFRNGITASTSVEIMACGDDFEQTGMYKASMGNGSIFLNPFRFYLGYRF